MDAPSDPPPSEDEAPHRGRRLLVVLAVVVLAGLAAGYYVWAMYGRESTDDAQIDADLVALPARVAGVVEEVRFEDNQHVDAGQILVVLDDDLPRAVLAQARAQLNAAIAQAEAAEAQARIAERSAITQESTAHANLRGASANVGTVRDQVAVAKAAVAAAKAGKAQAQLDFDRAKRLRGSGAMTEADLDRAKTRLDAAEATLDQALASVGVARSRVTAAGSQVAEADARYHQASDVDAYIAEAKSRASAARAQVQVARAAVDRAQLELDYTVIRAPRAGLLSKRMVSPGQQIAPGQAYGTLLPDEAVWVTANYKETQIGRMHPGQPVEIEVDTYSGHALRGEVESFAAATGSRFALLPPDNASGNFTKVVQRFSVKIRLVDTDDLPLRPGMSVVATIDVRENP